MLKSKENLVWDELFSMWFLVIISSLLLFFNLVYISPVLK